MEVDEYKGLSLIRTADAVPQAKRIIEEERSGEQYGLYSRFPKLNIGILKYFRFNQVNLIVGRSGSGKSFLANMLRTDLLNTLDTQLVHDPNIYLGERKITWEENNALPQGTIYYPDSRILEYPDNKLIVRGINRRCEHKVVLLHFGFEMTPESEILRTVANTMGVSYAELLSSRFIKEEQKFNKLSPAQLNCAYAIMDTLGKRKEYYAPVSGNLAQMDATVDYVANANPDAKIIISLDHYFLTRKIGGQGDGDLIQGVANHAIKWRQNYESMVILIGQFNNKIESDDRVLKRNLHFPTKADIHHGSQIWWAADNCISIHRPEQLGIQQYGIDRLDTNRLVHVSIIKSRMGQEGNVYMLNDLNRSRLHEVNKSFFIRD